MSQIKKPLLLMILDGWGYTDEKTGNAILAARTPVLDSLIERYPSCLLEAAGNAVGLPEGQMGNSEVGHLNIGAGRIVYQEYTRINKSIDDGSFFRNPALLEAIENVKRNNSSLHIMGLFSYGGVHSHMSHMRALVEMSKREGLANVYIHAFLDGRDVPPRAALEDMKEHEEYSREIGFGKVATVSGRYYAMDRDKRWQRTELAYNALTLGEGSVAGDPVTAIKRAYDREENDEFVKPTVIVDEEGDPVATVKDGDSLVFFNFRPDRTRQLTYAFVDKDFEGFERKAEPDIFFVSMTDYDEKLDVPVAFPAQSIHDTLGEVLSKAGLKQLRIAETEKYAHVTFFFNGGKEKQNPGEERCLIPSPKISTYDLKPEMSAYEVTEELIKRTRSGKYDVIILNFANMDMVGHSGIFDATVMAVEAVDDCVGKVINALTGEGGAAFITADHGNAEKILDYTTGKAHTAHTCNPVRCILVNADEDITLRPGKLADLAPSMLDMLGIEKPDEMTGDSLLLRDQNH
ncbi:2,3-bisphosphoglycerate-independent phosphoglycerate mutase [Methanolobus halotolerans]|uniref:2,3-bisphosphoglycerate-independent phosphoglycerate mutase n=1 Tax=Methanolobus halotolerans TaxID=2052935 RepID=A0A4E0PZ02_9EURY|nr:2,3-bisphosphoglycerate-independent phosphoglycerate mutase [Methanolobus halotolerans]TGC09030.1 2,3-bisphosphoglycerate-independent phosphoglycerate mutase [Methanolobus halotolerans]